MRLRSLLLALILATFSAALGNPPASASADGPVMQNPGFECGAGYHDQPGIRGMVPNGWTAAILSGNPYMVSTQMWATYSCDPNDLDWEKLEGHDSFIMLADEAHYNQGFAAPPFDLALFQPVRVIPGVAYSLSAWMTSLCGGSSNPSDCPPGAYMAKMAALDPAGSRDPLSKSLAWVEDRRPHTEVRWANLTAAATATGDTLTVFLRLNSPFQHHGNHAFADAIKLVRAPSARFTSVRTSGRSISLSWDGDLGPDIPAIPASTHRLSFEIQMRSDGGPWQAWRRGVGVGQDIFSAPASCRSQTYQFRIRAWAIQPTGQPGSWPFHEFMGVWQESSPTQMPQTASCRPRMFLPGLAR